MPLLTISLQSYANKFLLKLLMFKPQQLKDIERILRIFLMSLLAMTAAYKFIMGGDHIVQWYAPKFANNPYGLTLDIISPFIHSIAFIETAIILMLLSNKTRMIALYSYVVLLIALMFGHFALSEFHEVNGLFDYLLAGLLLYILPTHPHLLWREKGTEAA